MTSTASLDPKQNFTLVILQTELERVRFLIRSFLRARIAKVRTALATNVSLPPPPAVTHHPLPDRQIPPPSPPQPCRLNPPLSPGVPVPLGPLHAAIEPLQRQLPFVFPRTAPEVG